MRFRLIPRDEGFFELFSQALPAVSREPIRLAPLLAGQGLDECIALEGAQRPVEGARAEVDAGEARDVGLDRIAVLGPVGQADEDE